MTTPVPKSDSEETSEGWSPSQQHAILPIQSCARSDLENLLRDAARAWHKGPESFHRAENTLLTTLRLACWSCSCTEILRQMILHREIDIQNHPAMVLEVMRKWRRGHEILISQDNRRLTVFRQVKQDLNEDILVCVRITDWSEKQEKVAERLRGRGDMNRVHTRESRHVCPSACVECVRVVLL